MARRPHGLASRPGKPYPAAFLKLIAGRNARQSKVRRDGVEPPQPEGGWVTATRARQCPVDASCSMKWTAPLSTRASRMECASRKLMLPGGRGSCRAAAVAEALDDFWTQAGGETGRGQEPARLSRSFALPIPADHASPPERQITDFPDAHTLPRPFSARTARARSVPEGI